MNRLQALVIAFALAFVSLWFAPTSAAQDVAGMAGTVTDSSGAAIPNATITLTNASTAVKYTQTSSATGVYRFTNIPPGAGYVATFTAKGFGEFTVKDITLLVASVRTQNAALNVGAAVSTVEVTASNAEVTLDTTDATVGNDISVESLDSLPVQQRRDPTALFSLQPGVTLDGSVAGARTDQNYVTLDGLDVTEFANGNQSQTGSGVSQGLDGIIVGHAPIDSVEQFHAGVAGNTADTGAAGGGQFQLITRGGTNHFHGNLNEYHRDPSLVANSWFSNNASPIIPRNHLIQNQFGGNVGGPILRDKAFFFFNYDNSRIIRSVVEQRYVPTDTFRAGKIYYCTNPTCTTTDFTTPAQVKTIDPQNIGEDTALLTLFNGRFPHSNSSAVGDGRNTSGFAFNAPDNDNLAVYVTRLDYNINDRMKAYARFTIADENAIETPIQFPGDQADSEAYLDRSYAFVVGHNWIIGSNMTNRVFLGETVEKYGFPDNNNPMFTNSKSYYLFGNGIAPALSSSLYLQPSDQARRIPIPVIGDDFSYVKGNHTWQWGGTFKDILAYNFNVSDYHSAEIGLGGNLSALCGPTPGECGGTNPSLRPSDIDHSQYGSWDEPFAVMLGRIGNVETFYNYNKKEQVQNLGTGDKRYYRYYQMQLYLQDTWKLLPKLSVNYGLNYQWFSVPYETRGYETAEQYSFANYFGARIQQSTLGEMGPTAVPLVAYVPAGKGNGPGAPPMYTPENRLIAPHVGFDWNMGSDKKTVINGSAGIIFDRTAIFALQAIQDLDDYLYLQPKTIQNGDSSDPYGSLATDPRLDSNNGLSHMTLNPPPTPSSPYQPFNDPALCASLGVSTTPCGLMNGYAFNATIDPTLKTPYSMMFDFGVQRELPWNMVLKTSYVSRLGRRLLGQADANQVLDFPDTQSGQLLSTAFANLTTQMRQGANYQTVTPQPWFEDLMGPGATQAIVQYLSPIPYNGDIGDLIQALAAYFGLPPNVGSSAQFAENSFYGNFGFSSYNGLLTTLSKNLSHGVQFDFNYTWSHSIDNFSYFANSEGNTGIGTGIGLICDMVRPRECRARSDFDIRHYITTDAMYQLPFGKGRMFAATAPNWANEIIGNWDVSGLATFHTGEPWSVLSGAFVASFANDAPGIYIGTNKALIKNKVTKLKGGGVSDFANATTASTQFVGPVGFKIGPRNTMTGPGFFNADLGLAKTFPMYKESVNLKFRADAFNFLNHPSFALPQENIYNGYDQEDFQRLSGFGQIASTVSAPGNQNNGARVLQLALRLEF
jgi:hypothetical protein